MRSQGGDEQIRRGRPPWWLLGLVLVVVALTALGNFVVGYRGRHEPTTTTVPPPPLASLVQSAEVILRGRVTDVRRLGELRDPAVVASLTVEETFKAPPGALKPAEAGRQAAIAIYDKGFRVSWRRDDPVLVFLAKTPAQESRLAPWSVQERFVFNQGQVQAPFSLEDLRRATASGASQ